MTSPAISTTSRTMPNLTGLGWALVFAALALTLTGIFTSLNELLWIGVFLIALPIASWVILWATTPQLNVRREAMPSRVAPHTAIDVTLNVPKRSTFQPYLCEEQLPKSIGRMQRFVVAGFGSSGKVRYEVRPQQRGVWQLGPLDIFVRDYFGLSQRRWREPATGAITVFPEVLDASLTNGSGAGHGSREMMSGGVANHGTPDNTVRAYRRGDDRRRVHWRSTARRGELMVRNQSKTTPLVAAIVLDIGTSNQATADEIQAMERRISAAASAAVCLAQAGWQVDVVTGGPVINAASGDEAEIVQLLTGMAQIQAGGHDAFHAALASAREVQSASLSLLFVGAVRTQDMRSLRSYCLHASAGCAAIQAPDPHQSTAETASADQTTELYATLERQGWTVARTTTNSTAQAMLQDLRMIAPAEGTS